MFRVWIWGHSRLPGCTGGFLRDRAWGGDGGVACIFAFQHPSWRSLVSAKLVH